VCDLTVFLHSVLWYLYYSTKDKIIPSYQCLYKYKGWDPINRFNPATFLCLSQASTWISNVICHAWSFCVQLRWEMIVPFVGGIVDHQCLRFLFIIDLYTNRSIIPNMFICNYNVPRKISVKSLMCALGITTYHSWILMLCLSILDK